MIWVALSVAVLGCAGVYCVGALVHLANTMNATVVTAKHITVDLDAVVAKLTAVLLSKDVEP